MIWPYWHLYVCDHIHMSLLLLTLVLSTCVCELQLSLLAALIQGGYWIWGPSDHTQHAIIPIQSCIVIHISCQKITDSLWIQWSKISDLCIPEIGGTRICCAGIKIPDHHLQATTASRTSTTKGTRPACNLSYCKYGRPLYRTACSALFKHRWCRHKRNRQQQERPSDH